jgi:hypothetical protein
MSPTIGSAWDGVDPGACAKWDDGRDDHHTDIRHIT